MDNKTILESLTTRISQCIALVGLSGLLILASLTVMAVLARWLLAFPILGIADVSSLIIGVALASCFPLVFAERGSITVSLLGHALGRRANSLLDSFGSFVTMIIFIILVWQMWLYTDQVALNHETTWVVRWALAPWYRAINILFSVCVPILALTAYNQFKSFLTPAHIYNSSSSNSAEMR